MDLSEKSDEELSALIIAAQDELNRRSALASIPAQMENLAAQWAEAAGRAEGDPWVQPTGAHDAYPEGWVVTHEGREWASLTPANAWEPGVSGWREVTGDGEAPAEWVRPTGAHDAYQAGDRVTFEGQVYVSTIDDNTWSPSEYPAGWKVET